MPTWDAGGRARIDWRLVAFGLGAVLLAGCAGGRGEPPDGYCYRTLGAVDCYTTPEANRPPVGVIENRRPPPDAPDDARYDDP